MDLPYFSINYLNNLFDTVEQTIFLLGDFNVNLLSYDNHNPTNEFLDSCDLNSFIPYILQPTRRTSHSRTLIDNVFSDIISPEVISGNLTSTISDHFPQLMIVLNIFFNPYSNKQ